MITSNFPFDEASLFLSLVIYLQICLVLRVYRARNIHGSLKSYQGQTITVIFLSENYLNFQPQNYQKFTEDKHKPQDVLNHLVPTDPTIHSLNFNLFAMLLRLRFWVSPSWKGNA